MTEIVNAILLGVVQGLTEFLPVSSSGHIEIAEALLSYDQLESDSILMTVVLHFATALSTVVVFRHELLEIWRGVMNSLLQKKGLQNRFLPAAEHEDIWFCLKIVLSMFPAAVIGVVFEDHINALFNGQLLLVGVMLVVTGLLLLLADRAKVSEKSVGIKDAILIGIAQAVAILPGISRSGATISTSVLLGIDRSKAARFSFLMVVPLIFGKMGYDILKAVVSPESLDGPLFEPDQLQALIAGFLAAFFTGWLACTWMIKLVKACQLSFFSYYCFAVAAIVVISQLL